MLTFLKKDVFKIIKSRPVDMTRVSAYNNFVTTSYILTTESLFDGTISTFTHYDYDKGQLKDFTGKYYVLPSVTGYYSRIVDQDTLDKSLLLEFQIGDKFVDDNTEYSIVNYPPRKSSEGHIVYFTEMSDQDYYGMITVSEDYLKHLRDNERIN